jgi:diaminopimelate decarboxylase
MKACPNAAVVQLLVAKGLHIDASSCFEAARAIAAMVSPEHICICAQELHPSFVELIG